MNRAKFWETVDRICMDGSVISGAIGAALVTSTWAMKLTLLTGLGEVGVGMAGILFSIGRLSRAAERAKELRGHND